MLGQRRRRWANIGQTLGSCVVFAGLGRVQLGPDTVENNSLDRVRTQDSICLLDK